MWITPSGSNDSNTIHISASYDGGCAAQDPPQTLNEFGAITVGESYHLKISTNNTFTTVTIYSNDNGDPDTPDIYPFARASPTDPDHIGMTAIVYFMSGKFGNSYYNRGNGTFSSITITSKVFTANPTAEPTQTTNSPTTNAPTTEPPTSDPTADPALEPTADSTREPTADPTADTMADSAAWGSNTIVIVLLTIIITTYIVGADCPCFTMK